jgi:2-hydroxy-3-keto-5-methylthiopentenyl-1-phosphate phosphatase
VLAAGASLEIVSSGIEPLIRRSLIRNGVGDLTLIASGVTASAAGWTMHFRDDSPNGTDKAARVRLAAARGATTVFIGDGISDFEAALAADVRYAKRERDLEAHLRKLEVPFTAFGSFAEIDPQRLVATCRSFAPARSFLEGN